MPDQQAGPVPTAGEVSEKSVRVWEGLEERLAPIIGERGFRVLYARSLHLTQSNFPWIATPDDSSQGSLFASLRKSLGREQSIVAEEAHRTLFFTFNGLLNALIGEALASRLLQSPPLEGAGERSPESRNDR